MYQPLYGPKGLVIFDHPYNAESERQAAKSAVPTASRRSFITVRPHPPRTAAENLDYLARSPWSHWWFAIWSPAGGEGVVARRGDGGQRGSDHPARLGEDQVVPANGPGPVMPPTNSRTALANASGWSRMMSV